MKWLTAGVTFVNLSVVCGLFLGMAGRGLTAVSAALALACGLAFAVAAFLGTRDGALQQAPVNGAPAGSTPNWPIRILGPGRSAMMATRRPVAFSAARMRAIRSAWLVKSPWEKLRRATLSPARMRRSSISGDSEAGPMVATIFVFWIGSSIGVASEIR